MCRSAPSGRSAQRISAATLWKLGLWPLPAPNAGGNATAVGPSLASDQRRLPGGYSLHRTQHFDINQISRKILAEAVHLVHPVMQDRHDADIAAGKVTSTSSGCRVKATRCAPLGPSVPEKQLMSVFSLAWVQATTILAPDRQSPSHRFSATRFQR